nr:MAG TPA: YopX protein [Caudoviricetes sp.]
MEEIYLFRAKRLDNEEWVAGHYVKGLDMYDKEVHLIFEPTTIFYSSGETDGWHKVDPFTICQCTGLKDKNGKLIWENDIIECKNGKRNFQTQIEWDAYCAGFIFQDTETSAVGLDAIATNGLYSESKVIGNIFDNKELLESEEK